MSRENFYSVRKKYRQESRETERRYSRQAVEASIETSKAIPRSIARDFSAGGAVGSMLSPFTGFAETVTPDLGVTEAIMNTRAGQEIARLAQENPRAAQNLGNKGTANLKDYLTVGSNTVRTGLLTSGGVDEEDAVPASNRGLFERLLKDVEIRPYSDGHSETAYGDDSPTGSPIIYINDDLYKGDAKKKMTRTEALHLLKIKEPKLHQQLMDAAMNDPAYMASARHSYDVVTGKKPDENGVYVPENRREQRPFDKWHNVSRFDQVIGGYILAQDPDFPTMKNWDRGKMQMGPELRRMLEAIRQEFNAGMLTEGSKNEER